MGSRRVGCVKKIGTRDNAGRNEGKREIGCLRGMW